MSFSFSRFEVNRVDEAILINEISFDSYVDVHFYNTHGHRLKTIKKGVKSVLEIKQDLLNDQLINLDNAYIESFNINEFVENNEGLIEIKSISAKATFFNSDETIDFSNILVSNDEMDFSDAYFLKGDLNFHASKLAKKNNSFKNVKFYSGHVNFANCVFGSEVNTFKNSIFNTGTKNFQYANFSSGLLDFKNVNFGKGNVSFINSDFKEAKVNFKVSVFEEGKVDFHYAQFGQKDISFEQTDFGKGTVDFGKVDFGGGKVNFNRSFFSKGDVNFEGIDLDRGKLTFKKACFSDNTVIFKEAQCKNSNVIFQSARIGNATFTFKGAEFNNISFQSCHLNNYCDFRFKSVQYLDLQDSVVRDILDFIPYDHDVEVKSLNIYGLRLIGQIFIDWHSNKVFEIIQNQKDMSYAQKAYQYRVLKENFHNTGEYIAEDKAYVAFKRNESKAQLNNVKEKGNPISKFVGYTLYYFKNILLDKAGLYATSPARVLFSMLVSYIFFSLIFELTTILKIGSFSASTGEGLLSEMGDSFYFSIITYLTVGYGDFSPLGINRWIAGLEGFVGVFLMSYFTVAFVRRILR